MDHVYIIEKPRALPSVTWSGSYEDLEQIVQWMCDQDKQLEIQKVEFSRSVEEGKVVTVGHIQTDRGTVRLHNGWWLVHDRDGFFSLQKPGVFHDVYMTIPKEVPVAAG